MGKPAGTVRPETEIAIDAVERAFRLTSRPLGADDIAVKDGRDVVTATDGAIEDAVREILGDELGATVVGEERGGDTTGAAYWLVDPICGTRNFASGIPLYSVNLAYIEEGKVTVAVVGDPSSAEIVVAEVGGGAQRVQNGRWSAARCSATSSTVVIEDGHASGARREQAAGFVANVIRADRWDLRSLGTTLSLAYVATGRVAAYALFWSSAIHAAGGVLLATEAGAIVSDLEGEPWTIDSDSLLASADRPLHEELLALRATAT